MQGQAGVAAFFSALSELLKSPSKFLVCVHSVILDFVRDEKLRNDAPERERLQQKKRVCDWGCWSRGHGGEDYQQELAGEKGRAAGALDHSRGLLRCLLQARSNCPV
jgi:hypothetical protein